MLGPDRIVFTIIGAAIALVGLLVAGPLWRGASLPGTAYASRRLERRAARALGGLVAVAGMLGAIAGIIRGPGTAALLTGYTLLVSFVAVTAYTRRQAVLEDIRTPPEGQARPLSTPRWKTPAQAALLASAALVAWKSLRLLQALGSVPVLTLLLLPAACITVAALLEWDPATLWDPEHGWAPAEAGVLALAAVSLFLGLVL